MGYSREFIALNLRYAETAVAKTGIGFFEAVSTLTCIKRTVLGAGFDGGTNGERLWKMFAQNPGTNPAETILLLQAQVPARHKEENRVRSGILSATLPDGDGLSLLHFSGDVGEANPLGEQGLKRRAEEMANLLRLLKDHGPVNIGMFSWLLDGRFSTLFPPETEYQDNPDQFFQSLAVWGQYLRADGSLNRERASVLITNSVHPKKVLQGRVPAESMYRMYHIS